MPLILAKMGCRGYIQIVANDYFISEKKYIVVDACSCYFLSFINFLKYCIHL